MKTRSETRYEISEADNNLNEEDDDDECDEEASEVRIESGHPVEDGDKDDGSEKKDGKFGKLKIVSKLHF